MYSKIHTQQNKNYVTVYIVEQLKKGNDVGYTAAVANLNIYIHTSLNCMLSSYSIWISEEKRKKKKGVDDYFYK